jgi:hypothetical protein
VAGGFFFEAGLSQNAGFFQRPGIKFGRADDFQKVIFSNSLSSKKSRNQIITGSGQIILCFEND